MTLKCYVKSREASAKTAYIGDMVERNPMDKVERPKPRKDEVKAEEPAAYTADEVKKIMDCLDKEPLKWQALVHVLIDTGIRCGECRALKWSCIDFTTGAITIAGNLCYTVDKGVYLDTPKNGHTRTVYAGDEKLYIPIVSTALRTGEKDHQRLCFHAREQPGADAPTEPNKVLEKVFRAVWSTRPSPS